MMALQMSSIARLELDKGVSCLHYYLFNLINGNVKNVCGMEEEEKLGISLGDLVICALLYADDLVLFSTNNWDELQMLLKRLEKSCKGSLLEVNLDKTKNFPFGIKS